MNTFLALAKDASLADLKETMQYIKRIEKLAKAVEDVWVNSMTKKDYARRDRALGDLQALHDLVMEKIDHATLKILRYYEKHINDKYIMHIDEIASQISVGFWASYEEPRPAGMKRPQPWENLGAHLEVIPKNLLQQADRYVFRVIRTPIVTYNLRAYHDDKLPEPESEEDAAKKDEESLRPRNVEALNLDAVGSANAAATPTAAATASADSKDAANAASEESKKEGGDAAASAGGESETKGEGANEDTATAAAAATTENIAKTPGTLSTSALNENENPGVRQRFQPHQLKYVVGDLIHFEILVAPPTPFQLRVKRWTMRDSGKSSTQIRKSNYPTSSYCKLWLRIPNHVVMSDDLRLCVWDEEKQDWVEDGIAEFQYNEALRMIQCNLTTVGVFALVKNRTVDLPLKSFKMFPVVSRKIHQMLANSQLGNDQDGGGYSVPMTNAHAKVVLDATTLPGCIHQALLKQQFRGLPAPLPSTDDAVVMPTGTDATAFAPTATTAELSTRNHVGSIVPLSYERHTRLVLQTRSHELMIDVVGSLVALVQPNMPYVEDLLGVPMSPASLLYRLLKRGINLLPTDVDLYVLTEGKLKVRGARSRCVSFPRLFLMDVCFIYRTGCWRMKFGHNWLPVPPRWISSLRHGIKRCLNPKSVC